MRSTLAAVILALALASLENTDWTTIAKKVSPSVVSVQRSGGGTCTGFIINATVKNDLDYVMTAAHCAGPELFADNAVARVIWKDTTHDLMVLEVANTGRPALRLATSNPEIGAEVASYGYGMALARPIFRTAHVSDDEAELPEVEGGPFVMIDAALVGGQSGGPVVNTAGEVVMIVQRTTNAVGVGVGAKRIASRAGRYFQP